MHRRALVIGAEAYGLTAVLEDVERVSSAMMGLGFEVQRCEGADATRAGILAGYRRLIEACEPDDVAFLYYSGHGAWSADEAEPGPVQYIVPVDLEESSEHDFRGITALELSALMGELTSRTRNVTVVLDCCFSTGMSRDPGPVIKALETPRFEVAPHLRRLRAQGVPLGGPAVESNPHAVRLVAAGVDQPALEYTNQVGQRTGILTDSFLAVLGEARRLRISWAALGRRVRERVTARFPDQRPEIEGPIRRALFELEEIDQEHALAYFREMGGHWLRGGRLLGVTEGNEYFVMPPGSLGPSAEGRLARAEVVEVYGDKSRVKLNGRGGHIPEGAPAFLTRSVLPRRPVRLEAGHGARSGALERAVRERIGASKQVRLETDGELSPLAGKIRPGDQGLAVLDGEGDPVAPLLPPTPEGIAEGVHRLEILAMAQEMRSMEDGAGESFLEARLELEWGLVRDGMARPASPVGALLREGERVYIRLRNPCRVPLFASVFDVGVSGQIALLSQSQPSGINLRPGETEVLGRRFTGRWEGLLLVWPEDVPRTGARLETVVVVVSDTPQDLRARETQGTRALAQAPFERAGAYAVQRFSFWLSPSASSTHAPGG